MSLITLLFIILIQLYFLNSEKSSNDLMMKFLFAEKIFLFDSTDRITHGNNSNIVTTIMSPNMLPDTFICYLIIKNDFDIQLDGNFTKEFRLNYESSTSIITNKYSRQSVYKLYSLKLAEQLDVEQNSYELIFKLISFNNTIEFVCSLIIKVNTSSGLELFKRYKIFTLVFMYLFLKIFFNLKR